MPTYEYECGDCGHGWELFQQITAGPVRKCPKCKKPKARRLLSSGGGIIFKGSGFHTTDYRSSTYKKAAAADKPSGDSKPKEASKEASKS
ncbi:zinc ribbon domain-containing protein [bacterium]|nr:zinc ribbon domain-containing protein [bacterium]